MRFNTFAFFLLLVFGCNPATKTSSDAPIADRELPSETQALQLSSIGSDDLLKAFCQIKTRCTNASPVDGQVENVNTCSEFITSILAAFDNCSNAASVRRAYVRALGCMLMASCTELNSDPVQTRCQSIYASYQQLKSEGGPACSEIDD